ncbi:hypothetical protein SPRG_12125 [Saprolegnia parasitica CBS 223.65]|uniref:RING-type domain-containing protein n=1 Tax=Saprolegnia parasitica (strain CBS 223.65) TaxID=695850 RepID=A0A067BZK9_SAPPC|nr:hypothetical protein SPRG_12125 [Saprolegnia parasitica CBS 223.65]KDO22285.1 hypothetical protein SPRG_12125 [Saprolegnia parasitica CBS 223.65]|eukprot:XP_012207019.1 hypothetical protein SPRG_12125 [Saprolegnia parasitica CBS 223.65]
MAHTTCVICYDACAPGAWYSALLRAVLGRPRQDRDAWHELPCRHCVCVACLRQYLSIPGPMTCPVQSCSEVIGPCHVRGLALPSETRSRVAQMYRLHKGRGVACPECQYVSAAGLKPRMPCARCRTELCSTCHCRWHLGLSCAEFQRLRKTTGPVTADDVAFYHCARQWRYQQCPHCGIFTDRRSGCAAMLCRLCQKRWTWGRS